MSRSREAVKIVQTAGRQQLGEFAPDFARYNDDILFGEVWSKNDILPLKERCIVTISALVASGMVDSSLKYHLQNAKNNGITKEEMAEIITQLGFYGGWPKAWAAFNMAKEVYADESSATSATENESLENIMATSLFPVGGENVNYAQYFDGKSYLNMLSMAQVYVGNVTFEPGCRNHWHIHHADKGGGQILLVTAGRGYYQEWDKPAKELKAGDVVNIPANVKHWHGASPNSAFQHLAIEVPGENTSNEWCEPVEAGKYDMLL
ncbi:carboxymuconolactone decarboxylase family protein [Anaerovibrio sp. RM50]|uniref:carboxymuconolactone decarboxylase family protein n=1 Tax=Anaerovibrio sp. RM50 TaxID=1200557 RepID=UPI0004840EBE|nr:carboxymuconolactone decarboxylase family protein [Anaerovibrio sp. RM50]